MTSLFEKYLIKFYLLCKILFDQKFDIKKEKKYNEIIDTYETSLKKIGKVFIKEAKILYNKSSNDKKKHINNSLKKSSYTKKISKCEKCLVKGNNKGNNKGLKILLNIFKDISKLLRLFLSPPQWLDKIIYLIEIILDNLLNLFF